MSKQREVTILKIEEHIVTGDGLQRNRYRPAFGQRDIVRNSVLDRGHHPVGYRHNLRPITVPVLILSGIAVHQFCIVFSFSFISQFVPIKGEALWHPHSAVNHGKRSPMARSAGRPVAGGPDSAFERRRKYEGSILAYFYLPTVNNRVNAVAGRVQEPECEPMMK